MKEYFVGMDDFQRARRVSAMISANALVRIKDGVLRSRKAPIRVDRWMMDSGAFSQVTKYGDFIMSPAEYVRLAVRFQDCGNLACIATQDYMCEPHVISMLRDMGREASIRIHQRKTVERYIQIMDEAIKQGLRVPVMPVLQGWEVEDYVDHFFLYRKMLHEEALKRPWVDRFGCEVRNDRGLWSHAFDKYPLVNRPWIGIGSTCKRNKNPEVVSQILDRLIPLLPSNSKIHLFGYKVTGLKSDSIKDRIYSADSMAWSFNNRMNDGEKTRKGQVKVAQKFAQDIIHNNVQTSLDLVA